MLLDEYLQDLQKLTKKKPPTYEKIAQVLDLGSKQAVSNRIYRKQPLKNFEIEILDSEFKNNNQSTQENYTDVSVLGNVSASMGCGITVYDESKTGTYAISNKLAKDINANLNKCDVIFAKGDSMEPTIIGGDSLLVDRSKTNIYDGRIYCIRYEGELYAKRLQKLPPNKIKVVSDNQQKYDAWYVDFASDINFDFEIIGEVLWWGRVAR